MKRLMTSYIIFFATFASALCFADLKYVCRDLYDHPDFELIVPETSNQNQIPSKIFLLFLKKYSDMQLNDVQVELTKFEFSFPDEIKSDSNPKTITAVSDILNNSSLFTGSYNWKGQFKSQTNSAADDIVVYSLQIPNSILKGKGIYNEEIYYRQDMSDENAESRSCTLQNPTKK